ncbi:hypothetical protein [Streptomyces sp. NRRL S-337]|nr:hypothetical protein [Streptomyces sp. NRRL S-337]
MAAVRYAVAPMAMLIRRPVVKPAEAAMPAMEPQRPKARERSAG